MREAEFRTFQITVQTWAAGAAYRGYRSTYHERAGRAWIEYTVNGHAFAMAEKTPQDVRFLLTDDWEAVRAAMSPVPSWLLKRSHKPPAAATLGYTPASPEDRP